MDACLFIGLSTKLEIRILRKRKAFQLLYRVIFLERIRSETNEQNVKGLIHKYFHSEMVDTIEIIVNVISYKGT